jgi:PIN domain nuclease of toxin-antitoxin system
MGGAWLNLLLDTHIWLWSHLEPKRLSKKVDRALRDARNELWLSPISVWEFFLLLEHDRVRIRAGKTPSAWVAEAFASNPMHDAAVSREVAIEAGSVRLEHQDPADRLLVATARVYDLTLVTADDRLHSKGWRFLANT